MISPRRQLQLAHGGLHQRLATSFTRLRLIIIIFLYEGKNTHHKGTTWTHKQESLTSALPGLVNAQVCWGIDLDGGLPGKRAVVFADAAADAAILDHIRTLEGDGLPNWT